MPYLDNPIINPRRVDCLPRAKMKYAVANPDQYLAITGIGVKEGASSRLDLAHGRRPVLSPRYSEDMQAEIHMALPELHALQRATPRLREGIQPSCGPVPSPSLSLTPVRR